MKVVVTGASNGMGYCAVQKFLQEGHTVYGIDIDDTDIIHPRYCHVIADVTNKSEMPRIEGVEILINNAGVQNSERDMDVNFFGVKNATEMYGLQPDIKSILNQASVSAHTGAEFDEYCASKGAVLAYTKWVANQVACYGATCNSLSCGGVSTKLNKPVMDDEDCWSRIMDLTPLKKWATPEEIANWIYFLTVVNQSCTGQDIIIDNGETMLTHFVWPEDTDGSHLL